MKMEISLISRTSQGSSRGSIHSWCNKVSQNNMVNNQVKIIDQQLQGSRSKCTHVIVN